MPFDFATRHALIEQLSAIVGEENSLTDEDDRAPYLVETRDRYVGRTPVVLRPGTVDEVAAIMQTASEAGIPVVPQGGNTGTVGGQIPDETGGQVVLSLSRLNSVREVDTDGDTMTVDAGVTLHRIQEVANEAGRLFPLSLASEGSCQIGGNIATNAGGTAVLSYGNARDMVLGLEVVLANGEVWNGLKKLRKDNTGYDLKNLFIGSEGTLGIVTGAVLKLFPKPEQRETAFIAVPSPECAVALLNRLKRLGGSSLTAFEILPRIAFDFCIKHANGIRDPLSNPAPWYVLAEMSGAESAGLRQLMEDGVMAALEEGEALDAAIAESGQQVQNLWAIRHNIPHVQKNEGGSIKHDVSVPISKVPELLSRGTNAVQAMIPGARPVPFGHLGDGNIHFNISQPVGADREDFLSQWNAVNKAIHGIVVELGGSIAAEHGVGQLKRQLMLDVKSDVELDLMRRLKQAFDPKGILNPGKVLPD